ncbi:MAG: methyltransferase [Patescibacteria group bacterium]|nr:methyltransferase [Patescibacteria group bacterium]
MLTHNKKFIKNCKPALLELFRNDLKTYIELFFYEKEIDGSKSKDKDMFETLQNAGLLTKYNKSYYANVMVYPLRDKFIVTDFVFSVKHKKFINFGRGKRELFIRKRDQVWAMLPHETPQIIKNLKVNKNDIVLDLATGSGAIALFCADKAKRVYATDINPKAVEYAKFNAILNNLEHKIEFRIGDLFSPVRNLRFNYIVWNGPTVAAPDVSDPKTTYALSDFGGPDGADFTRRFIDEVRGFIKKDFTIQWYDSCLGNRKKSVSVDYLTKKFKDKNWRVEINHFNKNRGIPLSTTQKLFRRYRYGKYPLAFDNFVEVNRSEKNWLKWIKRNKLNFVHFAIITITSNSTNRFEIFEKFLSKNIVAPSFIYKEWHSMKEKQIKEILFGEGTLKTFKKEGT